jgi:hypothetical protein
MNNDSNEVQLPDYVLVNPGLIDDPAQKQGKIGVITAAILNTDDFYVGFDDKQVGLYSADALLLLKQPENIYEYLRDQALSLSTDDFRDLKNVALLLDHGTTKHQQTALKLLQKNESIIGAATIGLDELIGLKPSQGVRR